MKRRRPPVADIDVRSMVSSSDSQYEAHTPVSMQHSTNQSINSIDPPFHQPSNQSYRQLPPRHPFHQSVNQGYEPASPSDSSQFSLSDVKRSSAVYNQSAKQSTNQSTSSISSSFRSFNQQYNDPFEQQINLSDQSVADSVSQVFQRPLDRLVNQSNMRSFKQSNVKGYTQSNSSYVPQSPNSLNSSYDQSRSGSYTPSASQSMSHSVDGSVTMSVAREGSTIVALCELRAGGVVGVCCIDPSRAEILISQLNDSRTYNATMLAIYQFDPSLIIVPDTAVDSALVSFIQAERALSHANIHAVKRRTFNENTGLSSLELYCTAESLAAVHIDSSKYLCLAAVAAAMRHLEDEEGIRFVPLSLRLRETTLDELTRIDLKTAMSLELVSVKIAPSKNKRGLEPKNRPVTSVFDVLNHCTTVAGARLLRSSLLQPFRDRASIEARLEGVEELLSKPELVAGLSATLTEFSTFDRTVTSSLVRTQIAPSLNARSSHITHLLQLRAAVKCCDSLNSLLVRCTSELFRSMIGVLIDDSSTQIVSIIDQIIDVNANHIRSSRSDQRHTVVFALLPNLSSYLDTSRHIYSDTLSDLQQEAARVSQECLVAMSEDIEDDEAATRGAATNTKAARKSTRSRPHCSLEYSAAKGYHLAIDNKVLEKQQRMQQQAGSTRSNSSAASSSGSSLSSTQFISLGTRGRTHRLVTTPALNSLNSRHEEAFAEVMKLSHAIVEQALEKMRKFLPWLLTLSDEIAILDLLLSFVNACTAQAAAANQALTAGSAVAALTAAVWTRPVLTNSGPIALKAARHPVLNHRLGPARCVPNDAFLSETSNVSVLTGINMSGKSAYLRSIGTLTILAQIGCYLPAEYASIRICDEIIARCATGTDTNSAPLVSTGTMSDSTSTLFREMHDLSSVLARFEQFPDSRALLLFDEPARATDPTEGSSLAFAVIEHLSFHSNSYTLVATHFHSLTRLGEMYPNVQDLMTDSSVDGELHMISQFRVNDGACNDSTHYGIRAAAMCGMPRTIIDLAADLIHEQDAESTAAHGTKKPGAPSRKRRARHELLASLLSLRHATLTIEEVRSYLIQARNDNMSKHRRSPGSNAETPTPATPAPTQQPEVVQQYVPLPSRPRPVQISLPAEVTEVPVVLDQYNNDLIDHEQPLSQQHGFVEEVKENETELSTGQSQTMEAQQISDEQPVSQRQGGYVEEVKENENEIPASQPFDSQQFDWNDEVSASDDGVALNSVYAQSLSEEYDAAGFGVLDPSVGVDDAFQYMSTDDEMLQEAPFDMSADAAEEQVAMEDGHEAYGAVEQVPDNIVVKPEYVTEMSDVGVNGEQSQEQPFAYDRDTAELDDQPLSQPLKSSQMSDAGVENEQSQDQSFAYDQDAAESEDQPVSQPLKASQSEEPAVDPTDSVPELMEPTPDTAKVPEEK